MAGDRKLRAYFEYMFENMDYCVARIAVYFMSERELRGMMRTGVSKMNFCNTAYGDSIKQLKSVRPYFYTGLSELSVAAMLCKQYLKVVDTRGVEVNSSVLKKYSIACGGTKEKGKSTANVIIDFRRWSNELQASPEKLGAVYAAYLFETVPFLNELASRVYDTTPRLNTESKNVLSLWEQFNKAYNCLCCVTGQFMLNGASIEFVPYAAIANSYLSLLEDIVGYNGMNKPCVRITSPCIDTALESVGSALTVVSVNTLDDSIKELDNYVKIFSESENLERMLQQGLIALYVLYRVWNLAYRMTDAYTDVRVFYNLYGVDSFFDELKYIIMDFAPAVYEAINNYFVETYHAGISVKLRASFAYIKKVVELAERCNKAVEESGFNPFCDVSEFDRLVKVSDDEDSFGIEYTAFVERIRSHLMIKGTDGKAELVYGLGSEARKLRNKMRQYAPEVMTIPTANSFLCNSHMESNAVGFWGDGARDAAATLTRLKAGADVSKAELQSGGETLLASASLNLKEDAPIAVAVSGRDFIIQSRDAQQERFVNIHKGIETAKANPLNNSVEKLYKEAIKHSDDLNSQSATINEVPQGDGNEPDQTASDAEKAVTTAESKTATTDSSEKAGSDTEPEQAKVAEAEKAADTESTTNKEEKVMKNKGTKGSSTGAKAEPVNTKTESSNEGSGKAETIRVITDTPQAQSNFDLFSETAQPWSVYELGWLLGFDFETDDIRDILTELPNHSYNSCLQKAETLHSLGINTQSDLRRYLKSNGQN